MSLAITGTPVDEPRPGFAGDVADGLEGVPAEVELGRGRDVVAARVVLEGERHGRRGAGRPACRRRRGLVPSATKRGGWHLRRVLRRRGARKARAVSIRDDLDAASTFGVHPSCVACRFATALSASPRSPVVKRHLDAAGGVSRSGSAVRTRLLSTMLGRAGVVVGLIATPTETCCIAVCTSIGAPGGGRGPAWLELLERSRRPGGPSGGVCSRATAIRIRGGLGGTRPGS